jgi:uncharacterized protein (TIGR03067 family)
MKKRTLLAVLVSLAFVVLPDVTVRAADDSSKDFRAMIGNGLKGWNGNPKLWSAKDGVITGSTVDNPVKGNTFLIWTNGEPGDFELRGDFKLNANNDKNFANSGIQYRSKVLDPANWVVGGYQADMEAGATYTGILYEERMTRGIMATRGEKVLWNSNCQKVVTGSLGKPDELGALVKQGEWNKYVVVAKGNHLQHWINGAQMVDVIDDCVAKRAANGVIALQIHAGPAMTVQFRNLRIKTASNGPAASKDQTAIEGTWQITRLEQNGQASNNDLVNNITMQIKGTNFVVKNAGEDIRGHFKTDPAHANQIDIFPTAGPQEGMTLPGIYELNGDQFKVCYSSTGGQRPTAFDSSSDSSIVFITYQRKQ